MKTIITTLFALALLLCGTGCFRVSSETRALRDVALEFNENAEEKIEIGAGFFTVGLVKLGARLVELPPEAKSVLGSVHGVECSVYQLQSDASDHAKLLIKADKAMSKRGRDRIVGVIDDNQLVAVYAPRDQSSHRNMTFSVMVVTGRELVCATARGDLEPVLQLAYAKSQQHLPKNKTRPDQI